MKNVNVYLNFGGKAEEALNFYKDCMGGEIVSMQRYGDSPMDMPKEMKSRVMHAEFKSEGVYFMASDGQPGQPLTAGNVVSLSLNLDDRDEQTQIFDKLSDGGNVMMPLSDQFWGARFGMLTDKYGVNWMLNCHTEKTDKQYV